jgi:ribose transport system substrate-binding protein
MARASLKPLAAVAAAALVTLTACSSGNPAETGSAGSAPASAANIVIGQSLPTLDNPWYAAFAQGSKDMAAKLGVELKLVTNPATNPWDPAAQMATIENLIATKPTVIQIDPTSTDGINGAIDEARKAGIPVVTDGINVSTEVDASVVADNKQGGQLAGEWVAKNLPDGGDVAVLEGTPGRDIIKQRQDGFAAGIAANPGVKIAASQVANLSKEEGQTVAENIIQANPNLKLIWGASDTMALGALEALKTRDLQGKVMLGGFDGTPDAFAAIKDGTMSFTIDQVPYEMGAVAIALSYQIASGKDHEKAVILNTAIVDKSNVADYLDNADAAHAKTLAAVLQKYNLGG